MKKITWFLILASLFLVSCSAGSHSSPSTTVITTDPPIDPPVITPPVTGLPTTSGYIKIAFYDGSAVKFFDGSAITVWQNGAGISSGFRAIAHDIYNYTMDQIGAVQSEKNITAVPDFAVSDSSGNLWTVHNVPTSESGMLGTYCQIFENGTEYGMWQTRNYGAVSVEMVNDELFINGTMFGWHDITGTKTNINSVSAGLVVYDYDSNGRTATLNGVSVSWSMNFMDEATDWVKSGSVWYSSNGYTFDGSALRERTTPMKNLVYGMVAGTHVEGGETVVYFIEASTGWLYRYVPSLNTLTKKTRFYTGDGVYATGGYYASILKPVVASDAVYFCFDDGGIYQYRFDTDHTAYLTAGAVWMKGW